MENTNYYIFGASGHGKVVADCLRSAKMAIAGIVDDTSKPSHWDEIPILLASELSLLQRPFQLVLAIGTNTIRKEVA